VIDDPLQNLLHAAYMVTFARSEQRPGNWLAAIGEMDWITEINRTMQQVKRERL
jgi:hypothetical protein